MESSVGTDVQINSLDEITNTVHEEQKYLEKAMGASNKKPCHENY